MFFSGDYMNFKILFTVMFYASTILASDFEFTPIFMNFNSIEKYENLIICDGDYGSIVYSEDSGKNWQQKLVSTSEVIIKTFFNNDTCIYITVSGKIFISKDINSPCSLVLDLVDSCLSVKKYNNKYVLRTKSKLFLVNEKYKINKEQAIPLINPIGVDILQLHKSMTIFKNQIVIQTDSNNLCVYDSTLELKEKLSLKDYIQTERYNSQYKLLTTDKYFFVKGNKGIYKTNNFLQFDSIVDCSNYFLDYVISNDCLFVLDFGYPSYFTLKKYSLNGDSLASMAFSPEMYSGVLYMKDALVNGNDIYLTGGAKFIAKLNIIDSIFTVLSDHSSFSSQSIPDQLSDSTFILYQSFNYGALYNHICITKDHGITFEPLINKRSNGEFIKYNTLKYKYFDDKTFTLFLLGSKSYKSSGSVLISKDTCKTFTIKPIEKFSFSMIWPSPLVNQLTCLSNIYHNTYNNSFIISDYINYKKFYSHINTYNENFDLISVFNDSNYVINYLMSTDTNSFLFNSFNTIDSCYELKYTSDKGKNWNFIKKYSNNDSLRSIVEISLKNKKWWVLSRVRLVDTVCTIDMLDLDNKTLSSIYSFKSKTLNHFGKPYINITTDSNRFYLAVIDTIFYFDDPYHRDKWEYKVLPNNGSIKNVLKRFNGLFYANYEDDIRKENLYWIKMDEKAKEKPILSVSNYDFGKIDINQKVSQKKIATIYNLSKQSRLNIFKVVKPINSSFDLNLQVFDSTNKLTIEPLDSFSFEISFKPNIKKQYYDSLSFYSDGIDPVVSMHLTGEGIDTTTSVDMKVEIENNYLYFFPPFPLPANKEVTTLLYWDLSIDIEQDDIGVFDIYGSKIASKDQIKIIKNTAYSGYLTWDCSNYPNGVYIIKITHGNISNLVKVIISR